MTDDIAKLRQLIADITPPFHILVIDDNELCFKLLRLIMEPEAELTWAMTSDDGLKLLAERSDYFDVVIVDEVMPGLAGHMIVKQIRERWPDLITVLSSAYDFTVQEKDILMDAGPTLMMPKPLRQEHIQRLSNWIKQWHG